MRKKFMTLVIGFVVLQAVAIFAQTRIVMPKNSFPVEQDILLRQKYEPLVRRELKLLNDKELQDLVNEIGQRLVSAIPAELVAYEFHYEFVVVQDKNVNAYALPAGFIAINSGMIEIFKNGDELAAVMAHEISHVVLRHATAKMTKQYKFSFLELGILLGGSIGGKAGATTAAGSLQVLKIYQLKYSREFEKQADLLGAQILARAGYSPYNMQNVMRTVQAQSPAGPQWLASHPNPENRVIYLGNEARMLEVIGPVGQTNYSLFKRVQKSLKEQK